MPLDSQGRLQLDAVVDVPPRGVAIGEDEVGQGEEGHHHPDTGGEHLGEGDAVHPGVPKGLHNLQVAVDADEPEEDDGGVHVGVEQNCRVSAQERVEVPRSQLGVLDYLKWERQRHEKVCDHNVLEVKYKARFVSDVEENPHRQAVQQDACQEDDQVEHRKDDGGELVLRGVPGGARRAVGGGAGDCAQVLLCGARAVLECAWCPMDEELSSRMSPPWAAPWAAGQPLKAAVKSALLNSARYSTRCEHSGAASCWKGAAELWRVPLSLFKC